ncbi:MAG: aminodeoxychorismate synthase component I [Actinomycetota bacterium]|nr:aminodeoxychorismate synthase component I [Actinomycetota bacterium]
MRILSTITTIDLEIKPQDVACKLKDSNYLCYLDSSLSDNKYSKFSYIAWEPEFVIKSKGYKNEFIGLSSGVKCGSYQHPLFFLKQNIKEYIYNSHGVKSGNINAVNTVCISEGRAIRGEKVIRDREKIRHFKLPDFRGGFIGYFSYDLKNYIEKLPSRAVDDMELPLIYLLYYDKVLAYSHPDSRWYYIKNFTLAEKNSECVDNPAESCFEDNYINKDNYLNLEIADEDLIMMVNVSLDNILKVLKKTEDKDKDKDKDINNREKIINKYFGRDIPDIKLRSNMTRRSYIKKVNKIKEYIHNGDIYQANFSQRFEAALPVEPMDLYYILRDKNAAPFSAFLKFPEFCIGSSSPERFLFLKGDTIETRPIKGTVPRGKDAADDSRCAAELENSIKNRAELNMIVDLERNDLGKFCYYGTVKVTEHAVIEKYAKVFHSVSTVTGKVKKGTDVSDIIKAAFPGGSITGAPKIRAMEIIDELEPTARGIYTGSIGYIGVDSTIDLNIVIRTFVIKENKFYYNVGGGIVEDSIPADEYRETLDKGIALEETLKFFTGKNLRKLNKNQNKAGKKTE